MWVVYTIVVHVSQRLGQKCFSFAGLPVDQEQIARAHRRSDLLQDSRRHYHLLISRRKRLFGKPAFSTPLSANDVGVLIKRNWDRPAILVRFQTFARVV